MNVLSSLGTILFPMVLVTLPLHLLDVHLLTGSQSYMGSHADMDKLWNMHGLPSCSVAFHTCKHMHWGL